MIALIPAIAVGGLIYLILRKNMPADATRGERNHNPGNIKYDASNMWIGQVGEDDDGFVVFINAECGIRALAHLLRSYERQGFTTVRQMISRFSTTDRMAYINNVSAALGVSPDDVVDLSDQATMQKMIEAIIKQENGRNIYSENQLIVGINS